MSKFVVVVFDSESAAYEGSRAILELDREGSIAVYAGAVITKDHTGEIHVLDAEDEGPLGTATGMLVGTMIGALGGAVGAAAGASAGATAAALVAGTASGTLGGWYLDLLNVGIDEQFLSDVGDLMQPGKSAVVAEIAEGWTTPLDTKMESLGGTVVRRYRIDVEDEQIERDIEATDHELEELEEEMEQAVGDARQRLHEKVEAARAKLQSLKDRAEDKVASLKAQADAKLNKLDEQITKATGDAKTRFEQQRDEMKADYGRRIEKLRQAGKLTAEAFA